MSKRSAGRTVAVLLLGAAALAGPSPALGVEAERTTRTTSFSGAAALSGSSLSVDLRISQPHEGSASSAATVTVRGYRCTTSGRTRTQFDRLASASTHGSQSLDCSWRGGGDPPGPRQVRGTAVFAVNWDGVGARRERTIVEPKSGCTYHFTTRRADVSGSVSVDVPAIDYDGVARPRGSSDDHLTQKRGVCN